VELVDSKLKEDDHDDEIGGYDKPEEDVDQI
jgi:hypothetical protein